MSQPKNYDNARRLFAKHLTPRYRELDKFEAYVEGRQYVGLANWFNDEVPLVERAPHVVEPIVESAIETYQDFIFGEGHFPRITSKASAEDEAFDAQFGLSEPDSIKLDHLIRAIIKQTELQQVCREALGRAMGQRTGVLICGVRDSKLCVDLVPAKACTHVFDPKRPREVIRLEIKYPYIETFWNSSEKHWEDRCMLYRRVIDAVSDVEFKPFKANEEGQWPAPGSWTPNPDRSHNHGLGFCPVVWYPFMRISSSRPDSDGVSIHERVLDEIDALNRGLSQRNRAGVYAGDPQMVGSGMGEDEAIAPAGRAAMPPGMLLDSQGRIVEKEGQASGSFSYAPLNNGGGSGVRKRGVSQFWALQNPQASVEYVTIPEGSLRPLDEDVGKLRSLIAEAMSWVRPLEASSENSSINISRLSSKTLALLFKRQTSRCDTIRPDAWSRLLLPLISMLLRIVYVYADGKNGKLYLGGADGARTLLDRFWAPVTDTQYRWFDPILNPIWGHYFPPDEQDLLAESTMLQQEYEAGFVQLKTILEKRKEYYGIENVDQYIKDLKKEVEERKQEETDREIQTQEAIHALKGTDSGGAT